LFIAAYLAEDIRAGLRSVRPALVQAALATGLSRAQALRFVVVPIALRNVIPTLFNQYVRLFKFTSVASVIGVNEFTGSAMLVNGREFAPITIIGFVALTYLVLCFAISSVGRLLYARLAVRT
jgi:ABC-type amino acid transport system permease subunit